MQKAYPINMRRETFLILLFFHIFSTFHAQTISVRGRVTDADGVGIEYANVTLYSLPDTTFVTGAITDDAGEFVIVTRKHDKLLLKISFVGYQTQLIPALPEQHVIMHAKATELVEVSVKAMRPKVNFKYDRFEIIIENSLAEKGNTIEMLLLQLPGVWSTSSGEITINGVPGVQVIINDRIIKLSGEPLMRYLSSFRSEDISRIEVIQRPSATYEAEGGGIIRIITKNNTTEGVGGTISTKIDKQRFAGISPYISLQYNRKKFAANISMNGQKAKWLLLTDNSVKDIENETEYETQTKDTILDQNYSSNVDLFYTINKRNNLALNFNHLNWEKKEYIEGFTQITNQGTPSMVNQTATNQKDLQDMRYYSVALNYNLLLDSAGRKKITFISDFADQYKYGFNSSFLYRNYDVNGIILSKENERNNQENPYQIFSSEVRYKSPISEKSNFTTGMKYSNSVIENTLTNYTKTTGEWIINQLVGYKYKYDEQLFSTFFQFGSKGERWSFMGGIRGEYTIGHIVNIQPKEKDANIFPSLYLNYDLSSKNKLGLSYTRRINRVNYMRLIPRRYFISRYNVIEGNPFLKPDIINNVGLNYSYNDNYYFSISYSSSNNALSAYNKSELIGERSIIVSTYVDGVRTRRVNYNAYIPVKFTSWWSSINQFNLNYKEYEDIKLDPFSDFSYDIFTQQTFYMPWDIRGEILYRYRSASRNAYTHILPYHLLNAVVQKHFLSEKLSMKIEAGRILYNQKVGSESHTPTAIVSNKMYYTKRPFFAFTLSYSFSKGRPGENQNIQHSNEQEKSRTW